MAIARFILQNWLYFVGAGLVLYLVTYIGLQIVDRLPTRRYRDGFHKQTKKRTTERLPSGCCAAAAGIVLAFLPLAACLISGVFSIVYTVKQVSPTWPDLHLTLNISPATGTFTETEMFVLKVHATNASDVPVVLQSLTLPLAKSIVPDYLHATPPLTQTISSRDIDWHIGVMLGPGETYDVVIPLQAAVFGTYESRLYASITAERSYQLAPWDLGNLRPADTSETVTETQSQTFDASISWTILRK